jgi:hypothetical protein
MPMIGESVDRTPAGSHATQASLLSGSVGEAITFATEIASSHISLVIKYEEKRVTRQEVVEPSKPLTKGEILSSYTAAVSQHIWLVMTMPAVRTL